MCTLIEGEDDGAELGSRETHVESTQESDICLAGSRIVSVKLLEDPMIDKCCVHAESEYFDREDVELSEHQSRILGSQALSLAQLDAILD